MDSFGVIKFTAWLGDFFLDEKDGVLDIFGPQKGESQRQICNYDSTNESLLFKILNVDPSNPNSILNFYQTHGQLGVPKPVNNRLNGFRNQVALMRNTIKIHNAYKEKNIAEAFHCLCIYAALDRSDCYSVKWLCSPMQQFFRLLPKSYFKENPYSDSIMPKHRYHMRGTDTFEYDSISDRLVTEFSAEHFLKKISSKEEDIMLKCALEMCSATIEYALSSDYSHVEMRALPSPQGIKSSIIASCLNAIIFYEILERIAGANIIRQCACRTCNSYFQIYGNDVRKIYCSTRCAQLEAKRKQRERQKKANTIKFKE